MTTPSASDRIAALYGAEAEHALREFVGVVHVAAVWLDLEGEWTTILVRPDGPRSEADRFALELARARADAIVVTGRILRDEPELRYAAPGSGLTEWRSSALCRDDPPRLLILTRGAGLDPAHPALHGWARPLVYTREEAADSLRTDLPAHVEVVGVAEPSLAGAIAWLRHQGSAVVSIEAGPSTTAELYPAVGADAAPLVDELCVSELRAELAGHLRGPKFGDPLAILAAFDRRSRVDVVEPSGVWSIARYSRS